MHINLPADADILLVHAEIMTSTNIEARLFAEKKSSEKKSALFVADRQTNGRGRHGRVWSSLLGNAHFSYVFYPDAPLADWPLYSFSAVIALRDALVEIAAELDKKLQFKWPNDLLFSEKKCAGILLERVENSVNKDGALVVGVGVNLKAVAEEFSDIATAFELEGFTILRDELIGLWLQKFRSRSLQTWRSDWLLHSAMLNRNVRVVQSGKEIVGVALDVDSAGALILRDEKNVIQRCLIGDVFFGVE
jgi:BirA family biotin operon repressor/biotin-[acetyl-CoA-carboxylase] ligase